MGIMPALIEEHIDAAETVDGPLNERFRLLRALSHRLQNPMALPPVAEIS